MVNPRLRDVFARAVVIARAYAAAHTHEEGGNNMGDEVQFYLRMVGLGAGNPWCASFAFTCLVKAWCQLTNRPEDRDSLVRSGITFAAIYMIARSGYCPTVWASFRHLGLTCGPGSPVPPSSLVFYDFDGQGEPHHVGFVIEGKAGGMPLRTVEGNTGPGGDGSQSDGDGVFERVRPRTHVFGFVVPQ